MPYPEFHHEFFCEYVEKKALRLAKQFVGTPVFQNMSNLKSGIDKDWATGGLTTVKKAGFMFHKGCPQSIGIAI